MLTSLNVQHREVLEGISTGLLWVLGITLLKTFEGLQWLSIVNIVTIVMYIFQIKQQSRPPLMLLCLSSLSYDPCEEPMSKVKERANRLVIRSKLLREVYRSQTLD